MKYGLIELHDLYDFNTPIAYKELVMCKDCKHWGKYDATQGSQYMFCGKVAEDTKADDFCSWAERKESE